MFAHAVIIRVITLALHCINESLVVDSHFECWLENVWLMLCRDDNSKGKEANGSERRVYG